MKEPSSLNLVVSVSLLTDEGAVLVELGGVGVLVLGHAVALAVPRQRLLLLQTRPWRRRLARAHRRRVTETQHEQHAW